MHMSIGPATSVQEIQTTFKASYPHCRIILYKLKPGRFSGAIRTRMAAASSLASAGLSCRMHIIINENSTIGSIESIFGDYAPIKTEVRIRSGKIWKAAGTTSGITLGQLIINASVFNAGLL